MLVLGVAAGLAGCGLTPFGDDGIDPLPTGSITPAATPAPATLSTPSPAVIRSVDPSDWEAIRAAAVGHLKAAPNGAAIEWTNAETGNGGTIAALGDARRRAGGRSCRPIALTVSDVRGVRGYHGAACRIDDQSWQLVDITADDKTLL